MTLKNSAFKVHYDNCVDCQAGTNEMKADEVAV